MDDNGRTVELPAWLRNEADRHPPLLDMKAVQKLTTLSRTSIYELGKKGDFPKSVALQGVKKVFRRDDILRWIAERVGSAGEVA